MMIIIYDLKEIFNLLGWRLFGVTKTINRNRAPLGSKSQLDPCYQMPWPYVALIENN